MFLKLSALQQVHPAAPSAPCQCTPPHKPSSRPPSIAGSPMPTTPFPGAPAGSNENAYCVPEFVDDFDLAAFMPECQDNGQAAPYNLKCRWGRGVESLASLCAGATRCEWAAGPGMKCHAVVKDSKRVGMQRLVAHMRCTGRKLSC